MSKYPRRPASQDPFGLFQQSPTQPAEPQQLLVQQSGGGLSWVLVGLLLGVMLVLGWQRMQEGGGQDDRDRQHQEERDDQGDDRQDDKKDDGQTIEGKTLIFVHERSAQSIDHDLLLRKMPAYCQTNGLQFRVLDDDLEDEPVPSLKAFAALKGIQPPFVVLTDQADKPAQVIAWPTELSGLEELRK